MIRIGFRKTVLESIDVADTLCKCPKCQSNELALVISESYVGGLLGLVSIKKVMAEVVCKECDTTVTKKIWPAKTAALAEQKKIEYKPSWFARGGKILILAAIVVLGFAFGLYSMSADHQNYVNTAQENYAKCYDPDLRIVWYDNLVVGDFILANKKYDAPAQVFRVKEITENTLVLDLFDFTVPSTELAEMKSIDPQVLNESTVNEFVASKRLLYKGLIVDAAIDEGGPHNLNIQQILKK